jgi:hypothetical protein
MQLALQEYSLRISDRTRYQTIILHSYEKIRTGSGAGLENQGKVTFCPLKISDVLNKKSHLYAPGDSFLARPRRCFCVPGMRYNEFR